MRLVIAISRTSTLEAYYTTVHIAYEALLAGHPVRIVEPWDFEIDASGRLITRAHALDGAPEDRQALVEMLANRRAVRRYVELTPADILLLRVNPLDPGVLAFAQLAKLGGVVVHNDPTTLMLTGHKGYLATLEGVARPATLVTRSRATARLFAEEQRHGVITKPARSSGGRGVSLVRRPRKLQGFDSAFDAARRLGDGYVVVQEYLPGAADGEKRLVWLDGQVIGGYLRGRAPGDFRHNLARGGSPQECAITPAEHQIVAHISPYLIRDGVWLAGLDVIDDRIVEVNTLNPGGVHYGDTLNGTHMARDIVRHLEREHAHRNSAPVEARHP
jgi:glutathione synthase